MEHIINPDKIPNTVKCVYFDLGRVVFNFSGGLESIAQKLSIPLTEIIQYWKSQDDNVCLGKVSPQNFWINLLDHFSLPRDELNFVEFWTDHFNPIKETHQTIYKLHSQGIQLGILTNIYKGVFEVALKKGHIPNIEYHSVIQSCDIGLIKPNPEIFKHALSKTKYKPCEVILIDDRSENIEVAKKLGWNSFLFSQIL